MIRFWVYIYIPHHVKAMELFIISKLYNAVIIFFSGWVSTVEMTYISPTGKKKRKKTNNTAYVKSSLAFYL